MAHLGRHFILMKIDSHKSLNRKISHFHYINGKTFFNLPTKWKTLLPIFSLKNNSTQRYYSPSKIVTKSVMEKIQPAITILERIFTKLDKSDFLVNSELSSSQKSTITEVASKSNISMKTESIFSSIEEDLKQVKSNILASLDCDHPFLSLVAQSYFHLKGKHFRPTVLLTLSRALAFDSSQGNISQVTPKQLQLAEIVEMIHTASIIHDDVIDKAETRRGEPSINYQFGNKVAILSGDFLLARASIRLSYLENFEVTRLISTVIAELVEGELMQIKPTSLDSPEIAFQQYLDKTYKKTASLIANGCRAVALLGECNSTLVEIATNYGKNLGLAFQVSICFSLFFSFLKCIYSIQVN